MNTCTDCHLPIPAGRAVIRSESLKRVYLHESCAADRGIVTAGLAARMAQAVAAGVADAERYANSRRLAS